nr:unnamed protein product [Callosobruchus chinensis]CAH7742989.1 unnamed protein product [Callosobruchus chinensis]CAH7760599.1 unnamed protein product [Callosobruchus chinensis]CAH7763123.1 unnamed protein product [Callosobruchus chinensis]CAH7767168.1 unnamed protein product [Callosobruchus chinensis]
MQSREGQFDSSVTRL